MLAEFRTDTQTWFVDDTMFVIGLPSVDIFILFSTWNFGGENWLGNEIEKIGSAVPVTWMCLKL